MKYEWEGIDPQQVEPIARGRMLEEARLRVGQPNLPVSAQANALLAEVAVGFPVLAGETGVVNTTYPYGDVRRFGMGGGTDDSARLAAAALVSEATGIPLWLPGGVNILITENTGAVITASTFELYGPGRITLTPSSLSACRAIAIGNPNTSNNTNKSKIRIIGPEFWTDSDAEFLNFINLENDGGDLIDGRIEASFTNASPTFTGGDRWAISFGGSLGNLRKRIFVEHCKLKGRMQLTANGGNADYEDIGINYNHGEDFGNAFIALSRGSSTDDINNYRRITVKGNTGNTDRSIFVFLGMDGVHTAPQNWEDLDVDDNSFRIDGAGGVTPIGILFRPGGGSAGTGSVLRSKIRNNKSSVSSGSALTTTFGGVKPTTYQLDIESNTLNGGEVHVAGGSLIKLRNNTSDNSLRLTASVVAEASGNEFSGLRMEDEATLKSERNTYAPRSDNGSGINIDSAAGKTNVITSVDDTFDWRGSTGSGNSGIHLAGLGTITAKVIRPRDLYKIWDVLFFDLDDSQVLTEYGPTNPVLFVASTVRGNTGTGEDNLETYTVPAGLLSAVNRGIEVEAWGRYENNANAKTLKIYFGTAVIGTFNLTVGQSGTWWVKARIVSTSTASDTQDVAIWFKQYGTTAQDTFVANGTATENEEAAIVTKLTAEATTTSDIRQEGMKVTAIG